MTTPPSPPALEAASLEAPVLEAPDHQPDVMPQGPFIPQPGLASAPMRLAAIVAQRLCHDLVNPMGAIQTGLELLALDGTRTAETDMMQQSLAHGLGRIRLYRLALGISDDCFLERVEIERALAALGGSRPLELSTALSPVLTRRETRLLLLMGLCVETALAWGGKLEVEAGTGGKIRVRGEARRVKFDDVGLWTALARGEAPEDCGARHVHFALCAETAGELGRKIKVEPGAGWLVLEA